MEGNSVLDLIDRLFVCKTATPIGLNKVGSSAGPRFDSGRNPINSNQYGFEQIDPQARVLNYCYQ